jgi:hypothetical protein
MADAGNGAEDLPGFRVWDWQNRTDARAETPTHEGDEAKDWHFKEDATGVAYGQEFFYSWVICPRCSSGMLKKKGVHCRGCGYYKDENNLEGYVSYFGCPGLARTGLFVSCLFAVAYSGMLSIRDASLPVSLSYTVLPFSIK